MVTITLSGKMVINSAIAEHLPIANTVPVMNLITQDSSINNELLDT